jgi:hypothetical protein
VAGLATLIAGVPSRVEMIQAVREASDEANAEGSKLLARYYEDHPELAEGDAAQAMNDFNVIRVAVGADVERRVRLMLDRHEQQLGSQQQLVSWLRFLSPAILMQDALNDISGTGTARHRHFRAQVSAYHNAWRDYFMPLIFRKAQLPGFSGDEGGDRPCVLRTTHGLSRPPSLVRGLHGSCLTPPVGESNARWLHCAMQTPPPPDPAAAGDVARATVRQLAATLAYRAAKVVRDVPPGFGETTFGPATRRPVQIVAHMADLMAWGVSMAQGGREWKAGGSDDWDREVARFFDGLATLDMALAADGPFAGKIDKIIQGPLADALTHVGQLALLRGMSGAPLRPESYARAAIEVGRVGRDQAPPGFEFDGDASARR